MAFTKDQLAYAGTAALKFYEVAIAAYIKRRQAALRGWVTRRKKLKK